jgi:hypothetical protein
MATIQSNDNQSSDGYTKIISRSSRNHNALNTVDTNRIPMKKRVLIGKDGVYYQPDFYTWYPNFNSSSKTIFKLALINFFRPAIESSVRFCVSVPIDEICTQFLTRYLRIHSCNIHENDGWIELDTYVSCPDNEGFDFSTQIVNDYRINSIWYLSGAMSLELDHMNYVQLTSMEFRSFHQTFKSSTLDEPIIS